MFGRTPTAPFDTGGIWKRSRKAWTAARLTPLTLHEARHTFASLMIAAGVNAKALTTYMGHASVRVTFDRYGHLMPGNERGGRAPGRLPREGDWRADWRAQPLDRMAKPVPYG